MIDHLYTVNENQYFHFNDPQRRGVMIRLGGTVGQGSLTALVPRSLVAPGDEFIDEANGVRIKLLAIDAGGAQLEVKLAFGK